MCTKHNKLAPKGLKCVPVWLIACLSMLVCNYLSICVYWKVRCRQKIIFRTWYFAGTCAAASQCHAEESGAFTMETGQLFLMVHYCSFFGCNISIFFFFFLLLGIHYLYWHQSTKYFWLISHYNHRRLNSLKYVSPDFEVAVKENIFKKTVSPTQRKFKSSR